MPSTDFQTLITDANTAAGWALSMGTAESAIEHAKDPSVERLFSRYNHPGIERMNGKEVQKTMVDLLERLYHGLDRVHAPEKAAEVQEARANLQSRIQWLKRA